MTWQSHRDIIRRECLDTSHSHESRTCESPAVFEASTVEAAVSELESTTYCRFENSSSGHHTALRDLSYNAVLSAEHVRAAIAEISMCFVPMSRPTQILRHSTKEWQNILTVEDSQTCVLHNGRLPLFRASTFHLHIRYRILLPRQVDQVARFIMEYSDALLVVVFVNNFIWLSPLLMFVVADTARKIISYASDEITT